MGREVSIMVTKHVILQNVFKRFRILFSMFLDKYICDAEEMIALFIVVN